MGALFQNTPEVFGTVHLLILAGILLAVFGLFFVLRYRSERQLRTMIGVLGILMILAEIWKQWFVRVYVYPGIVSFWFFPWQLCSMAMYVSAALLIAKGKAEEAILVFLASFNIVAALGALIFPYDMMRPQIWLFCHSFLYHGVMLIESMAAILILAKRKRPSFIPALSMYAGMAVVAEIVNVISHQFAAKIQDEANMFNITLSYPSTQPVFHQIAVSIGIVPEIFIYLGFVALLSYGIYRLVYLVIRREK
ncbi:MAG: YwaF family protein [Firmicutes bacterium]|nr:YwaF family protein [Bacillota bacterium]